MALPRFVAWLVLSIGLSLPGTRVHAASLAAAPPAPSAEGAAAECVARLSSPEHLSWSLSRIAGGALQELAERSGTLDIIQSDWVSLLKIVAKIDPDVSQSLLAKFDLPPRAWFEVFILLDYRTNAEDLTKLLQRIEVATLTPDERVALALRFTNTVSPDGEDHDPHSRPVLFESPALFGLSPDEAVRTLSKAADRPDFRAALLAEDIGDLARAFALTSAGLDEVLSKVFTADPGTFMAQLHPRYRVSPDIVKTVFERTDLPQLRRLVWLRVIEEQNEPLTPEQLASWKNLSRADIVEGVMHTPGHPHDHWDSDFDDEQTNPLVAGLRPGERREILMYWLENMTADALTHAAARDHFILQWLGGGFNALETLPQVQEILDRRIPPPDDAPAAIAAADLGEGEVDVETDYAATLARLKKKYGARLTPELRELFTANSVSAQMVKLLARYYFDWLRERPFSVFNENAAWVPADQAALVEAITGLPAEVMRGAHRWRAGELAVYALEAQRPFSVPIFATGAATFRADADDPEMPELLIHFRNLSLLQRQMERLQVHLHQFTADNDVGLMSARLKHDSWVYIRAIWSGATGETREEMEATLARLENQRDIDHTKIASWIARTLEREQPSLPTSQIIHLLKALGEERDVDLSQFVDVEPPSAGFITEYGADGFAKCEVVEGRIRVASLSSSPYLVFRQAALMPTPENRRIFDPDFGSAIDALAGGLMDVALNRKLLIGTELGPEDFEDQEEYGDLVNNIEAENVGGVSWTGDGKLAFTVGPRHRGGYDIETSTWGNVGMVRAVKAGRDRDGDLVLAADKSLYTRDGETKFRALGEAVVRTYAHALRGLSTIEQHLTVSFPPSTGLKGVYSQQSGRIVGNEGFYEETFTPENEED